MNHIKKAIVAIVTVLVLGLSYTTAKAVSLQEAQSVQLGLTESVQTRPHVVSSIDLIQEQTEQELGNIQAEMNRIQVALERIKEEKAEQEAKRAAREAFRQKGESVAAASETVSCPGPGWCAKYVAMCYEAAGFDYLWCNADDLYYKYCTSSDLSEAESGMIIAVATDPHNSGGIRYGHCGIIFRRDGELWVRHNSGTIEETPIQEWIDYYGVTCTPLWGWGFDEQSQSHSTSLDSYDRRGDFISRTNRVILGIVAFVVAFMSFFVDTNVANAADSLHYSSAMAVAYNTSVDGNEFLYEGYADKEQWQSDYDTELAELRQLHSELLELQDYLSEDNKAIVNNLDFSNFKYISLLNETVDQFTSIRDEAQAAKEQELERQQQQTAQQQSYSGDSGNFKSQGVIYQNGIRYTYYSSNVLYHYRTPEWNAGSDGIYRDSAGYIIVASSDHSQGSVVSTPFGAGKVYDSGCASGTIDIYTNF